MAGTRQGQIVKRGPGTYMVRVYRGKDTAGKRHWATVTVKGTRQEAQKELTRRLAAKDAGRLPATTRQSVDTYFTKWLATDVKPSVTARTHASYTRLVNSYVIPALGLRKLASVNAQDVQELVNTLTARNLSPRTIRYTVSILRAALRRAVSLRLLPVNPVDKDALSLPAAKHREYTWLTPAQAAKLFATSAGDRLAALWHVAVMTALRPGEYLALRWSDIDLNGSTLTVRRTLLPGGTFGTGKTPKSRRTVTLPASTVLSLKEHKRRQNAERLKAGDQWEDGDLVFCTALGRPLDHNNVVHYHFQPLLERAELPRIRLYDLRHTGATLLLEAGESLKVVSERLGHASIVLTADVYSHVSPTMQTKSAERLESLLAGA